MNDVQLAIAIKEGDSKAFKLFFKKYYKLLLAYITTFTNDRDRAEDIVQQSFVILWEKRHLLDPDRSPKHYLFTIAQNKYKKSYKELRRKGVFYEELKEHALRDLAMENSDYLKKQLDHLRRVIDTLPPKCKEILILNKFEGLKYYQIAERLQVSIKTVESQMRIAYQKIREAFKEGAIFLLLLFDDSKLESCCF